MRDSSVSPKQNQPAHNEDLTCKGKFRTAKMSNDLPPIQKLLRRALVHAQLELLLFIDRGEQIFLWFRFGSHPLNIPYRLWALLAIFLSFDSFILRDLWAVSALWGALVSSSIASVFFLQTRGTI